MPFANFRASKTARCEPVPQRPPPNMEPTKDLADFLSDPETQRMIFVEACEVKEVKRTKKHEETFRQMHAKHMSHLKSSDALDGDKGPQPGPETAQTAHTHTALRAESLLVGTAPFDSNNEKPHSDVVVRNGAVNGRTVANCDPSEDAVVLEVVSSGFKFPGCQVLITTTVWVQLGGCDELPEIQLTLLDCKQKAKGTRVVVWMFHRIMGHTNTDEDKEIVNERVDKREENVPKSLSYHTVGARRTDTGEVFFQSDVRVEVRVKIPKSLVSLMPISIERFEFEGSKKIRKMLNKDVDSMLVKFRAQYIKWLHSL